MTGLRINKHITEHLLKFPGLETRNTSGQPGSGLLGPRRAICNLSTSLREAMHNYDITIRIDEYGMHLCRERTVKRGFHHDRVFYNEPFESWPVELNRGYYKMIYQFRCEYPSLSS
jgi:hypothetical protein